MHAQWNNFHSSRTACHGPVAAAAAAAAEKNKAEKKEEEIKPRRISIKRVSGILREWSWDKALGGAPPMPGSNA